MKFKRGLRRSVVVLLFVLLTLTIFLIPIHLTKAESPPMPSLPGNVNPENLEKFSNVITDVTAENATDYLKKEWGKILAKSPYTAPIYNLYVNKIAPATDPVFKIIIGLPASLSWLFILTLIIWISILIFIFRLSDLFPLFSGTTKFLVFLGISIVFTVTYLSKKFAILIVAGITKFNSTWYLQLLAVGLVIIFFVTFAIFSKAISQYIKQLEEKRKKDEEEEHRRELSEEIKLQKEYSEKALGARKRRMPRVDF